MDNNIFMIVDGNSLANRAFFAMRSMSNRRGVPTNAVYGFVKMLEKAVEDHKPSFLTVAFDIKGGSFRNDMYADYKGNRKPMDDDLSVQLPIIKDILKAMKIPIVEKSGFEADDVIGTICKKTEVEQVKPLVITGDRDLLQLISNDTEILFTKKGVSDYKLYDIAALKEEYDMTAEQFLNYKGLKGDSSDNIPGVPGIGEKSAKTLIWEFETIENVYENIESIKQNRIKNALEGNEKIALLSRDLATIRTNVPLKYEIENFKVERADKKALAQIYADLDFNSFLKKIDADIKPVNRGVESLGLRMEIIDNIGEPDSIKRELQFEKATGKPVGLMIEGDDEHLEIPEIEKISLFLQSAKKIYEIRGREAITVIIKLIDEIKPEFFGHNLKRAFYSLIRNGVSYNNLKAKFDTEIAEYVLNPGVRNLTIENIAITYLSKNLSEADLKSGLLTGDIFCIMEEQKSLLRNAGAYRIFKEIELPLVQAMASMEATGFAVDEAQLDIFGENLEKEIADISRRIYELAGSKFNISSTKQLAKVLFQDLGLKPIKKTKTGYSTNSEVLDKLVDKHEIIGYILRYRTLTKLLSTYVKGLVPLIAPDGRIHAHFNQTIAATGRISSSNPNMQNIPIRDEEGRSIRKAFVSENDNFVLIGADYSQIELRVLVHMSKDEGLIKSFREAKDIHRATAARVLNIDEDKVTAIQRSDAKAINFGIIYGISGFGLSKQIDVPVSVAEEYIKNYFNEHEKVKMFMDEQIRRCEEKGYVETIFGRRRNIPEINAKNFVQRQAAQRMAMNTPVQGSAADIIKRAMIRVNEALAAMRSRLVLQIHDELIIEAHIDEAEQVKSLLQNEMQKAAILEVDLIVDIHEGRTLLDLK